MEGNGSLDYNITLHIEKGAVVIKKTYNTRDSPVVTDPSTSLALTCLSMGERTGSRVFKWIWSYVIFVTFERVYQCQKITCGKGKYP